MACDDYSNLWEALEPGSFSPYDFAVCPYADVMGAPVFGVVVLVGIVNLPIYIKQESLLVPMVLTLGLGGLLLAETAGLVQGIVVMVLLLLIGLGPIALLRRIQQ